MSVICKLAASILSADIASIGQSVKEAVSAGVEYIHVDVMDGVFVDNITFGLPIVRAVRAATDAVVDVHLMIIHPSQYVGQFADAGADIVNFHLEAAGDPREIASVIREHGKSPAITINPWTSIKDVVPYLDAVDMVLVMSVNPGFGGQKFLPQSLKRAEQIKNYISQNNLKTQIEMDGGITAKNVRDIINAGADIVVCGSSVFGADSVCGAVKEFRQIFAGALAE
ncbi:hypothetical protein AGMMS49975_05600 [Clostridia bacterium]|nr:hypothetical protein AGMMS49975_05600 [Clostridia bacterium]